MIHGNGSNTFRFVQNAGDKVKNSSQADRFLHLLFPFHCSLSLYVCVCVCDGGGVGCARVCTMNENVCERAYACGLWDEEMGVGTILKCVCVCVCVSVCVCV